MPCPSAEELTAYHTGRLNEAAETRVYSHIETCNQCEAYLDHLDDTGTFDPMIASLSRSMTNSRSADVPTIPGYVIEALLGRGGMGQVFRGRQLGLDRLVALKMLSANANDQPEMQQRFRREAAHLARLRHPHVVTVYDVGEHGGQLYFSMEYCTGGTLAEWQARRPLPPRQAAELLHQLAEGVAAAHAAGVIHRDLKPANILLATAEPVTLKISDFGIARQLDSPALTQSGLVAGTPNYMAPEQIGGKDVGPTADVHALGAILFEMLTGRPVFLGADVADTLDQIKNHEPISPSRIQPGVPRDLAVIMLKCLQKDPRARYQSATELADDLQRFLNGETIRARPTSLLVRTQKWAWRHPGAALAIAISGLAIIIGLAGVLYYTRKLEDSLSATRWAEELATQNAQAALGALDTMVGEVTKQLHTVPGGLPVRNKILESALVSLDKVVAAHDPNAPKMSAMSAWQQISRIQWSLGQSEKSIQSSDAARQIAIKLLAADPKNEAVRHRLPDATWHMGCQQLHSSQPDKARETYADYVAIAEAWVADNPTSSKALWQLGRAYESAGHAAQWVHQFDVADTWFNKMSDAAEKWRLASPTNKTAVELQARANLLRGTLASDRHEGPAAKQFFTTGLELYQQLLRDSPDSKDISLGVQTCHYELGMNAKEAGDLDRAARHSAHALAIIRDRVSKFPGDTEFELELVDILYESADIDRRAHRTADSQTKLRECQDRLTALDKAGKLAGRPVYAIERRKQVDDALANQESPMTPKR